MHSRFATRRLLRSVLSGAALLTVAVAPVAAQEPAGNGVIAAGIRSCKPPATFYPPVPCPPAPCPAPVPPPQAAPPSPEARPPEPLPAAPTEPALEEQAAASAGEMSAFGANIIGDLLYGSRSVSFKYLRSTGPVNVLTNGSTNVTNPSIAENNSPIPRDRVYFRFNYFDNAVSVTGINGATFAGVLGTATPATKSYSVEQYTFGFEKTFLNQRASLEMRVPFVNTVSNNLNLSTGNIAGPLPGTDANGNPFFAVNPTPDGTLGRESTIWGNMTLILKGLAYQGDRFFFTAGSGLDIPTGPDQHVRVVDYTSTALTSTGALSLNASGQRVRDFQINNSTWALAPFVAALATPTNRSFVQGFLQVDVPLNSSHISYSDQFARGVFGTEFKGDPATAALIASGIANGSIIPPPFAVGRDIVDQPLMHVNLGTGYWLLQNPNATWVNGIAPVLELHYTTTLRKANVVALPSSGSVDVNPTPPPSGIPEPGPKVGNLANRLDILDLTVGSTFVLGNRATLATGFAFPLRGGDDRLFNWEFQLQLNYYFGASQPRFARTFTPNF